MLCFARTLVATFAFAMLAASPAVALDNGVIRVKSAYSMQETVDRIKKDVAAKGIMYFTEVDQSQLAAAAGIKLRPSTLLIFGNPGLGTLFITAKAEAGLDWPVRLLVTQDDQGQVWAVYTDFKWIAERHGIRDRDEQFATATGVITSITSAIKGH
jgi:uncharacterized protein (DUF302 family)